MPELLERGPRAPCPQLEARAGDPEAPWQARMRPRMSDGRVNWSCQVDKRDGCARRRAPFPASRPSPVQGQGSRLPPCPVAKLTSCLPVDKSRSDPGDNPGSRPGGAPPPLLCTFPLQLPLVQNGGLRLGKSAGGFQDPPFSLNLGREELLGILGVLS